MRDLSPFIKSIFTNAGITGERVFNTQIAMEIILQNDAPLNVASADVVITSLSKRGASLDLDVPIVFTSKLMTIGKITHSQGEQPDAGTQGVTNLDYIVGQLIPHPDRLFSGASVTIYLCFPKDDGTYEGLIYFIGKNRSTGADDDYVQFALVSDISDKVITLGEELTQSCTHTLGDGNCGAQHLPVDAVCSFIYDDADGGCAFYGAQDSHSGVPFLNPNENPDGLFNPAIETEYDPTQVVSGGNTYIGGVDPGVYGGGQTVDTLNGWDNAEIGGGCVDPASFIETAFKGYMRGTELAVGDALIDPHHRIGLVEKLEIKYVQFRYLIECDNGAKLVCSADHPLIRHLGDDRGKLAHEINTDLDTDQTLCTRIFSRTDICGGFKFTPLGPGNVLKISMSGDTKLYSAGVERGMLITGHNQKSIFRDVEISSYLVY